MKIIQIKCIFHQFKQFGAPYAQPREWTISKTRQNKTRQNLRPQNKTLVQGKWNKSGFRPPLCTYRLNWARRTSWGWWDDWDDTVLQTQDFEIRALAVWGWARYLSVTEAPHDTDFHTWMGKKHFLFLSNRRDREPNTEFWREKKGPRPLVQGENRWSRCSSQVRPGFWSVPRKAVMEQQNFRPLWFAQKVNWRTSWGWWEESDGSAFQTQKAKFERWWSEVARYLLVTEAPQHTDYLQVSGDEIVCLFKTRIAERDRTDGKVIYHNWCLKSHMYLALTAEMFIIP